ncbi:MAG: thioredoxin domain-containing protein [Elusimicrobia bacterium]|nr:thioredoxin domain-containing protein [Elusimicrobiota bacterium]MDE2236403.1 thioredoxin domain-containing protein [Elusimicrobiota bacterium]MDE2425134.1 thioredoxin domain-containing protein [Elusimicrobiota bacterium]
MKTIPAALAALLLAAPAFASAPSTAQLKKILSKHPDILLDVLKENRKALFDIVSQAAQEEQARREKEEQAAEEKDFEESFKHPKTPEITEDTLIRGNKDAKFTLVEYSDFQCPYCGRGYYIVEALRKKYGDNLRFIFKDMPLPFHPEAMPAARWFEAVALQSPKKAWLFHDKLFQNQNKLGEQFFKDTAKELGIDVAKAEKDAAGKKVAEKIAADTAEAKAMGFTGTPGFLLNGIPVKGAYPVEHFDEIIARLESEKPEASKAKPEAAK